MKSRTFSLLLLSLAANALLAFFLWREPAATSSTTPSESTKSTAAAMPQTQAGAMPAGATAEAAAKLAAAGKSVTWQSMQTGRDLPALVASLRGAGFPPAVIRAVVNQLLNEKFADQYAAAMPPYWKRSAQTPAQIAAQQAVSEERRKLFESLLGDDARASAALDPTTRLQRYGNLSDAKIDAVAKIERDYNELRRNAYSQGQTNLLGNMEERQKQQAMMEREMRADLASVLTPEELESFELRNSTAASKVMNNIRGFDVTEQEYAALYRLQQASDTANHARTGVAVSSPEAAAQMLAAQQALGDQVRTVLTDDRFYKYLQASDYTYAQVMRSLSAFPNVTPAAAYEVTKIQRDLQSEMMRMSKDTSLPTTERAEQYRTLVKTSEGRIDALLGPDAAAAYKKQGMGRIFTSLRSQGGG
ncbi:MAG: hypothetical protein HZA31_05170 [Opitutae bacterium]|nr:hypothetical protein [Opitutae bacterium]